MRTELSADEIAALSAFLSSPARPDGTLTLHQLQGFLFAIVCSPELILPSEWLPIISNDEDMRFEDVDEAQKVLEQIMVVYNQVNAISQELAACLVTLSFFSSRQMAEAVYREGRGGTRRMQRKSLEQLAETMRELFPSALASYANLGRTISEVLASDDDSLKQPTRD